MIDELGPMNIFTTLDARAAYWVVIIGGSEAEPPKCQFAALTIDFLGFTISPEGVSPNHERVLAISKTPPPCTPDFTREFELHTDTSSIALGACLIQRDDLQIPYTIAYYSRKLRDPESRYPTTDLEALAVVEGVRVFDSYLYGRHFIVYTDHRPLVYVFSRKNKSPRMTRFAHDLSFYNFTIRYKEGPANCVPDLLSRQVAKLTITELSPEKLAEEQGADPQLADIRRYLMDGTVPKKKLPIPLSDFEMKDGVLYRLKHLSDRICYQLVVPESLKNSSCITSRCTSLSMDIMDFGPNVPVRWALSILDQHSRYLQIVPLWRATAAAVHRAFLDHWVTIFGPPESFRLTTESSSPAIYSGNSPS
ncbi:uncharacterized protein LOC119579918 [Penaeus monodon]|uniref:uncharacterized protein LOC119579918 n=1 Tax=Penaeus monodon TaxID=6687 RepID=UPI0018A70F3E|nr:uncharacterized protein LOC119579918 [Penaeus monodon]